MAKKVAKKLAEIAPFDINSFNFEIKHKFDLTAKQIEVLKVAQDPKTKMIILDGYPGTAKTFLSMLIALEKLRDHEVQGITAFRSTVQSKDGETGFFTGDWEGEKGKFLGGPFYQKMEEVLKKGDMDTIATKAFSFLPSSVVRSYSFRDECLILSEAQNCFFETIFTAATRAGEGSFVIVEGDSIMQNDLGDTSGFSKFCKMFNDEESMDNGVRYFKFDETDVVRSGLVQYLVEKRLKNAE